MVSQADIKGNRNHITDNKTGTILLIIICVFTLFMMTIMTMFSLFSMDPYVTHQPAIYSVFAALITGLACTIASIIYLIRHLLKIS